jgi:cytochrome P450
LTTALPLRGPRGRVLTGNLPEFAADPLGFLTRTARDFGPVSPLRFARMRAFLVSDPAMIEEMLVRRRLDFIKAAPIRRQRRLFGKGLLINEGSSWAKQRRLAQPAFHPGTLGKYTPVMAAHASTMLERWSSLRSTDIHEEAKNVLMRIAAESLFGPDVAPRAAEIGAAVEGAMDRYAARRGPARLLPDWVPLEDSRRYVEGVEALDAFVEETIAHRRVADRARDDLLNMLMCARDEDGAAMSPGQIRDEAINLFVGGFDTPSLAIAWAWYLLAKHPGIAERVHSEVDDVLGDRVPEASDLSRLQFTQLVLRESMRLYPPAWLLGREAVKDTELGGIPIPGGATVLISQWVMHRHPGYFDDATEFRPDRWIGGPVLPRFVYFPFGAGPRVCIGAAFATMECTFLIAMIARRFRFAMATDTPVDPHATMTLRPRGGMPAAIIPR